MKFKEIKEIVGHVPFISTKNARYIYDLILREEIINILELGMAHGTATCFMAAALQELGRGSITAVDLNKTKDFFKPSAEQQLKKSGLSEYAKTVRMHTGYTWFLHDEILRNTKDDCCQEVYDLCIIDGPKNWTIDGAAFFMADKLLKKNGWIIFDDYNWTYASRSGNETDGITHRELSEPELETPHVREIFELLVKQHPDYGNFYLLPNSDWAVAQKTKSNTKNYNVVYDLSAKDIGAKLFMKFYKRFSNKQ